MHAMIRVLAILAWLCLLCSSGAASAPYRLRTSVLSAGGLNSAGGSHQHSGTLGQPIAVGRGQNGNGAITTGFWGFVMGSVIVSDVPEAAPTVDHLLPNFPNPFNPATRIEFSLSSPRPVIIEVYDLRGAKVRTLLSEVKPAGVHHVMWNGSDDRGRPVASGVYFYRLRAGDYRSTRKMLLVK